MVIIKKSTVALITIPIIYLYTMSKSTIPGRILTFNKETYTEGDVYEAVWSAHSKLPHKVKEMLQDNNYRIHVIDMIQDDPNITGITYYGPRIIEIKNDMYYVRRTMFHECGHVLDDESHILYISGTSEFKKIYEEEKDYFVVDNNYDYFVSTEAEYFASAFSEYMLNPHRLKENTPKTYEFIERCLK